MKDAPNAIVVMGVAGSGKTTIGMALASALGWEFADADDLHSPQNRAKMTSGIPLTDADREPWLQSVRRYIEERIQAEARIVVACSALKESYRELLTPPPPAQLLFVYLDASEELTLARLRNRQAHFMKENMLSSQFATLETPSPQQALVVDASQSVAEIVSSIRERLRKS